MNYKYLFKNFFFFCACVLILGWGMQWFLDGLIDFSEWKISQNKNVFLGSIFDSAKAESADNKVKTQIPYRDWQIKDTDIAAQSAISVESDLLGEDKILFKKAENKKLAIASLTKLMTAMVAMENYNLADTITISKNAVLQEGTQSALKQGDVVSIKDLLYIMLIESNNHAAYALSEAKGEKNFVELMNKEAEKLGLKNTHFADSTGLSSANYSTSEDLIKLTKYSFKNYPIIIEISRTKEINLYKQDDSFYAKLVNTNELLGEIPDIVGGKTGFTTSAKGCLILVLNNHRSGNYLFFVILGAGDRFGEMKKLINWVNTAYIW